MLCWRRWTTKRLSSDAKRSLELATASYERHLEEVRPYLEGRGITASVASSNRLGCVRDPASGHGRFTGYLSIPYVAKSGVVAIKFRCIRQGCTHDDHGKYDGPVAQRARLYNVLDLFAHGDRIALTEGELDALTLSMIGVPAVAAPGSKSWKSHWNKCLEDHFRVTVFCDGDPAGKDFGKRVAGELDNAVLIELPEGEDVNSLYCKYGGNYLKDLVEN